MMRELIFIAGLALVCLPTSSQPAIGTWELLEEAPDAGGIRLRHDDVHFLDGRIGWVVNLRGEVWHTGDGGVNWTKRFDNDGAVGFRSVAFATAQLGWAGTVLNPGSVLFETRDGGFTWTEISGRIEGAVPTGVCGLTVLDEQLVFGAGFFQGDPRIVSTTDGGLSWTSTDMSHLAGSLVDIHFLDRDTGFAVGGTGAELNGSAVILRTVDGGASWSKAYASTRSSGVAGEWGWKISFPTRLVGYVSVEYNNQSDSQPAKVLVTRDGGGSWSELSISGSTEAAGLQGIGFVTKDIGWASGRGTTSVTIDGGLSWTQLDHWSPLNPDGQLDGAINRIFVLSDTVAYAVGRRVYRYNPSVATAVEPRRQPRQELFRLEQNFPNPFGPSTTIRYQLFSPANVRVRVFDVAGRHIRTLVNMSQSAGRHVVNWDGLDETGRPVASGSYVYLMDVGESPEMKRMVLLR